ncbi:MAG: hypothetical protein AAGJ35_16185, partial [Myxococcota bacterium]
MIKPFGVRRTLHKRIWFFTLCLGIGCFVGCHMEMDRQRSSLLGEDLVTQPIEDGQPLELQNMVNGVVQLKAKQLVPRVLPKKGSHVTLAPGQSTQEIVVKFHEGTIIELKQGIWMSSTTTSTARALRIQN